MPCIVLTGGGTAGHVTPHLALLPHLQHDGWSIHYIGSVDGIERDLVRDVPFYGISTGKLRRYFDWKNFTDPFRVLKGTYQAFRLLGAIDPDIIFSKGGFVSVPVALAASMRKLPLVLHESDYTPGLANRLVMPFAVKVCTTFPETLAHCPPGKGEVTGTPVREELLQGSRARGKQICGFAENLPCLLVMGGSQGSLVINERVWQGLSWLTERFNVIHLCGRGHLRRDLNDISGYKQFEYAGPELSHFLAAADFAVSRAGANTLMELLALRIPSLLIPLSEARSRGDQILNAESFQKQGFAHILREEEFADGNFRTALEHGWQQRAVMQSSMGRSAFSNGTSRILDILRNSKKAASLH